MNTSSTDRRQGSQAVKHHGPDQADVDELRHLLDLLEDFSDNDQRARYLLTCNWMRDRGAIVSARLIRTMSWEDVVALAQRRGIRISDLLREYEATTTAFEAQQ